MFPIVVEVSRDTGVSLIGALYLIMIASSSDFLTPFGYQTNLMVREPGGYKFIDYPRLGLPLSIVGLFLVPGVCVVIWPPTGIVAMTNSTNVTTLVLESFA